jgi:hypothetical protein
MVEAIRPPPWPLSTVVEANESDGVDEFALAPAAAVAAELSESELAQLMESDVMARLRLLPWLLAAQAARMRWRLRK